MYTPWHIKMHDVCVKCEHVLGVCHDVKVVWYEHGHEHDEHFVSSPRGGGE